MIIKFGPNKWINTDHILKFYISGGGFCVTIENYDRGTDFCEFASKVEVKNYIEDILIPICNKNNSKEMMNKIHEMSEEVLKLRNKCDELDNAFKYIAGGKEYQQAFKEYYNIIQKDTETK